MTYAEEYNRRKAAQKLQKAAKARKKQEQKDAKAREALAVHKLIAASKRKRYAVRTEPLEYVDSRVSLTQKISMPPLPGPDAKDHGSYRSWLDDWDLQ